MRQNLKAYKKVGVESSLLAADPHQIILMLFNGLLESLSQVKGAVERKDFQLKANLMSKGISIINSLDDALDHEAEPKISENFSNLYQYCSNRLMEASVSLDTDVIDEVVQLLKPIRDAWSEISVADKEVGFDLLKQKSSAKSVGV